MLGQLNQQASKPLKAGVNNPSKEDKDDHNARVRKSVSLSLDPNKKGQVLRNIEIQKKSPKIQKDVANSNKQKKQSSLDKSNDYNIPHTSDINQDAYNANIINHFNKNQNIFSNHKKHADIPIVESLKYKLIYGANNSDPKSNQMEKYSGDDSQGNQQPGLVKLNFPSSGWHIRKQNESPGDQFQTPLKNKKYVKHNGQQMTAENENTIPQSIFPAINQQSSKQNEEDDQLTVLKKPRAISHKTQKNDIFMSPQVLDTVQPFRNKSAKVNGSIFLPSPPQTVSKQGKFIVEDSHKTNSVRVKENLYSEQMAPTISQFRISSKRPPSGPPFEPALRGDSNTYNVKREGIGKESVTVETIFRNPPSREGREILPLDVISDFQGQRNQKDNTDTEKKQYQPADFEIYKKPKKEFGTEIDTKSKRAYLPYWSGQKNDKQEQEIDGSKDDTFPQQKRLHHMLIMRKAVNLPNKAQGLQPLIQSQPSGESSQNPVRHLSNSWVLVNHKENNKNEEQEDLTTKLPSVAEKNNELIKPITQNQKFLEINAQEQGRKTDSHHKKTNSDQNYSKNVNEIINFSSKRYGKDGENNMYRSPSELKVQVQPQIRTSTADKRDFSSPLELKGDNKGGPTLLENFLPPSTKANTRTRIAQSVLSANQIKQQQPNIIKKQFQSGNQQKNEEKKLNKDISKKTILEGENQFPPTPKEGTIIKQHETFYNGDEQDEIENEIVNQEENKIGKPCIAFTVLGGGEAIEAEDQSVECEDESNKTRINIKNILEIETYLDQICQHISKQQIDYLSAADKFIALIYEDPSFSINQVHRFFNDENLNKLCKCLNVVELVSICAIEKLGKTKKSLIKNLYPQMSCLMQVIHQTFLMVWDLQYIMFSQNIEDQECLGRLRERIEDRRQVRLGRKKSSYLQLKQNYDLLLKLIKPLIKPLTQIVFDLNAVLASCEEKSTIEIFNSISSSFGINEASQKEESTKQTFTPFKLKGTIRPYLPPRQDSATKPYTLVLDLDETLIHFYETKSGGQFNIRPFCQKFLSEMSKVFELVIFTAGTEDYANWVLDILDTQKTITYRLYRQHTLFKFGVYIKDLSKIGRDLTKTIIIDNVPENFRLQKDNGITIKSWYTDKNDTALKDLIPILSELIQFEPEDLRQQLKKLRQKYPASKARGNYELPR